MTKHQENTVSMLKELLTFLDTNDAVLSTIPNYITAKNRLKALMGEINSELAAQLTNVKGHTKEKDRKKAEMIDMAAEEASKLLLLGVDTKNEVLVSMGSLKKSELARLRDNALIATVRSLHSNIDANLTGLAAYDVTAASQAALLSLVDAYSVAIDKKSIAVINRVSGTSSLADSLKEVNPLVKRLRILVGMKHERLLSEQFEMAARIGNAGVTHNSISGFVADDEDGAAIANVLVQLVNVDSGRVKETKTNINGGYLFRSVGAGGYKIQFQRAGFFDYVTQLDMAAGERKELNVEMSFDNASEIEGETESN